MSDLNQSKFVSSLTSLISQDINQYLNEINFNDLMILKKENIHLLQKIKDLEEKNSRITEEMHNFKKVSLLNNITNMMDQKNKEVDTLKQVIKSRDTTINSLKQRIDNIEKKIKTTDLVKVEDNYKPEINNQIENNNQNEDNNQDKIKDNKQNEDIKQVEDNNLDEVNEQNDVNEQNGVNEQIENKIKNNKQIEENKLEKEIEQVNNNNKIEESKMLKLKKKKIQGIYYYFENNKLFSIEENQTFGSEVGIYLEDKKKFKFHK